MLFIPLFLSKNEITISNFIVLYFSATYCSAEKLGSFDRECHLYGLKHKLDI